MTTMRTILIVDDDAGFFTTASLVLSERFSCRQARSGEEALANQLADVDAVLLDIELGRGIDGFQVLEALHARDPDLPVIMISRREDLGSVTKAMRLGACDYIGKHFNLFELALRVEQALALQSLEQERRALRDEVKARFGPLVGESSAVNTLRDEIAYAAAVTVPVLITGERGSGKELVARAIHESSARAMSPFVPVDCTPSEGVLEAELFGRERDAVPGGSRRLAGLLEVAGTGTLFMDEIAAMPLKIQSLLLQVIETQHFSRLASSTSIRLQARLITATSHDLEQSLDEGALRRDLIDRLGIMRIRVPPLRERLEDLESLVRHLTEKKAREMRRPTPRISEDAMRSLSDRPWPGNVRELENTLEAALIRCSGEIVEATDLPVLVEAPVRARVITTRETWDSEGAHAIGDE
ncbi:MAG: sigma-54 dependent transcriptional regulator [Planctomycetota bacterium]